jgi:aryl-alcohol dehydrogenase-like predicted oxidoreductase
MNSCPNKFASSNKITKYFIEKNCNPLLILGTWVFGGYNFGIYNQQDAVETLEFAYKNSIRTYDIATFYAKGNSNTVLEKYLKRKCRNEYILCAKAGLKWKKNSVVYDGSEKNINLEIEMLLNKFKTNYIDVYLLHWPDPNIKLTHSLNALEKLKKEKKVKFIGICNINSSHLIELDKFDIDTIHIHNNVLKNNIQKNLIKSIKKKYHTTIFSIFENGILVNPKYMNIEAIGKKDIRRKNPIHKNTHQKEKLKKLFSKESAEYSPADCILTWTLNTLNFDTIIIGPKNISQIKSIKNIVNNTFENIKKTEFYNYLNTF